MSNVELVQVLDPIVDIPAKRFYGVIQGATDSLVSEQQHPNGITNQLYWNVDVGKSGFISRDIKIKCNATLTFTGTVEAGITKLINSNYDSLRANPLSAITMNCELMLNGRSISCEPQKIQSVLDRIGVDADRNTRIFSTAPTKPDVYQLYADGVNTNKNPLASFDDSDYIARGAFPCVVSSNDTTSAVITYEFTENIKISPLVFGYDDKAGFRGVEKLEIRLSLDTNFKKMWSHAPGKSTITAITGVINSASLLYKKATPTDSIAPEMPLYTYPYSLVNHFEYPGSSTAPNAPVTITSSSLQLAAVPNKIILVVGRKDSDKTHTTTDTFFNINSINVTYGNKAGLLASMTEEQIFNMSRDNGYVGSFSEWKGFYTKSTNSGDNVIGLTGSIAVIEVGKDIVFGESRAPGLKGVNDAIVIRVSAKNVNQTETIIPELKVIYIYPGYITIESGGKVDIQEGLYDVNELTKLIASSSVQRVSYSSVKDYYGGAFEFGDIGKFLKGAVKMFKEPAKQLVGMIPGVGPIGSMAVDALGNLIGDGRRGRGGVYVGGESPMMGGVSFGGAKMQKKSLRQKVMNGI